MVSPVAWLRHKRVWIPLALIAAYGLFGFFVAPPILRTQIVAGIRKNLGREASLQRVRFNPFIFALTLEGFELRDPDGTPFVAFDRLYVDFQLSSLPRMALTFREVSLTRPRVHVRVMPKGETNFVDLIPKEDTGKPPRLIIGRLAIDHGSLELTNLMDAEPENGKFEPLDLELRNFTTIPDQRGQYHVSATGPGGGSWEWTGSLVSEPMHASGVFEIRDSQLRRFWEIAKRRVPFEITDGRLSCRFDYDVKTKGDSVQARLVNSMVSIAGLGVRQKDRDPELLRLDTLMVSGIDVRYPEQTASVARVLLAGTRIKAWLEHDHTLNWLSMLPPATPPAATAKSAPTTSAPAKSAAATRPVASSPAAAPWDVSLHELAVRDLGVAFEDRSVRPPFAISVTPVNVTVRNISSRPGAKFDVQSDVTIAEKGKFACSGQVTAKPASANLKLSLATMPLAIFQTYVSPIAKVSILGGSVGASGNLTYRDRTPAAPDVHFTGRAESRGLLIRDRIDNERFLTWKGVDVEKIDATPSRLRIGSILLTEPYAKFIIHRDRTTNVQEILGIQSPPQDTTQIAALDDDESAAGPDVEATLSPAEPTPSLAAPAPRDTTVHVTLGAPATPAKPTTAATAGAPAAIPVRIGEVQIRKGSADFADLSLILPFAARIADLKGRITGISSDSASRAGVEADGALQPSGTAQVRGAMNPLAKDPVLDLAVVFRGFNMPGLTPYTGQYLGREVDKGEMSLDLQYKLEGKHLVGENKIVLDQMELGKKVESPEATKLPVGLALAIMKDREGKIDLDVPVEGNVDDPKFRIGRVIMQFLLRLLTKVAMSPFALLGHMFGGGGHAEQLDHVDFALGASDLPGDQQEKLGQLAKALDQRPQLKLEVRGRSDADSDAVAIRKSKFATLAAEKIESNPKKYGGGLGYSPQLLEDLYVDRFGKKGLHEFRDRHQVAAGSLPPDHPQYKAGSKKMVVDEPAVAVAIQTTLTGLQTADAAELLALANARGSAIKQSLVAQGVDGARVYVTEPQPGKVTAGRVRIDLTLTD